MCFLVTVIAHFRICGVPEWGDGEMVIIGGRPKKGGGKFLPMNSLPLNQNTHFIFINSFFF